MKKYKFSLLLFFLCGLFMAQEKKLQFSMQEAIDYAIENNYDNKIAVKNIKAAEEKKWETTTIGLPQISGKIDYQNWLKQQVSVLETSTFDPEVESSGVYTELNFAQKQTLNPSLTLTQLIFDGSYLVGLQSAKTYLKISEQAKLKTELATREAVVNAYGNVLVAEKSIEILGKNKRILQKTLDDTQKVFENGLTEQENVEQLQITLGTLENNIRNTQRLKEIAYQMLNITLGNKINKKIVLTDTLESLSTQKSLELLGENFNINNHIDYQIALNSREANELLMKLEKSKYLPSLSAYVNYGANHFFESFSVYDPDSDSLNDKNWFDYSLFGFSLNVPIFSSFGRRSKVAQAKIELENSDIRLEQLKQQLNLQAASAKSEYKLSIENHGFARKNLTLAERIEKKQQIKFIEGLSSSFDLSQAQNQLYTQQNSYIQSMMSVIAKKATLENALNLPLKK